MSKKEQKRLDEEKAAKEKEELKYMVKVGKSKQSFKIVKSFYVLLHTGCTVITLNVPAPDIAPPGTGPFGVGTIAWLSTTNVQSPGPDCIITASPPSVRESACVPQPSY